MKTLRRLLIVLGTLLLLEFFPGTYVIDSFQDEWEPESVEGMALLALQDLDLEAELWFERPTRQRISRHAELIIPADSRLSLQASMIPEIIGGEAVARPRTWNLESSRSMTFIYRGVTVARAKKMLIRSDDPELRVRAQGTYRLLSALFTAHRYHRQNEVRRDVKAPDRASLSATARFLPGHSIPITGESALMTGSAPSRVQLQNLQWEQGEWTAGTVDLQASFSNLEVFLNTLAKKFLSEPIDLGRILAVHFRRLHALTVAENRLFIHADGSITSANSSRVAHAINPSFGSRLEIEFQFPEGQFLHDAVAGARLKQIHSFDMNRTNPLLDKSIRNLIRSVRNKASVSIDLSEYLNDAPDLPPLFFERFGFLPVGENELLIRVVGVIPETEPRPGTSMHR